MCILGYSKKKRGKHEEEREKVPHLRVVQVCGNKAPVSQCKKTPHVCSYCCYPYIVLIAACLQTNTCDMSWARRPCNLECVIIVPTHTQIKCIAGSLHKTLSFVSYHMSLLLSSFFGPALTSDLSTKQCLTPSYFTELICLSILLSQGLCNSCFDGVSAYLTLAGRMKNLALAVALLSSLLLTVTAL